ncbi:bacteriocin-protection, YdeI or OmpD-associated-domain-containing protein [Podospora appendiculata]|uniref:Bacteriocin-protection, YdeI or OmpD-associated-domain-containing protein n=1 Tax=Podospora appendiculata TaxID=314037 RepID=A0AAE1C7X9_9PEZI|nr:bacteriocin-protection, YdeI or OmpD-associated-domain-containing protein [Podospora appendiculata]
MSRRTRSATRILSTAASKTATPSAPAPPPSTASLPIQLFRDANAWESWLETNHHTETSGLWVKISKKDSGVASVTYEEALDTALCFGWIDGQRKGHDDGHFLQKFTPRRKSSLWSKRNVAKVAVLIEAGRMRAGGQAEIDAAKADGRWQKAYASSSNIKAPPDFQKALDRNKEAKVFFDALNKSKRYSFLWRIETAKRDDTRRKRIEQFVGLLADHKTL